MLLEFQTQVFTCVNRITLIYIVTNIQRYIIVCVSVSMCDCLYVWCHRRIFFSRHNAMIVHHLM